ncbi:exported hypothetical protein [Candidatus Zixiibacteriota bacterium]|nr:exported hypothetical protein [candidate division Zixibacteria bacterium]
MCRFLSALIVTLTFTVPAGGSELINLIRQGQMEAARRIMDSTASAVHRDGNRIFAQAILEPDGPRAMTLLETARQAGIDPADAEYLSLEKALFYFAAGWPDSVLNETQSYLRRWENGRYRAEMMSLEARAGEILKDSQTTNRLLELTARENPDSLTGLNARLQQARIMAQQGKYTEARKVLKRLIKSSFDNIASSSLYLLSQMALEQKRNDDALFYFNLLKEEFPDAVGLDDLSDQLSNFQASGNDQSAEKITGTTYAVQVGVFSVRDNAMKMTDRMKKYNQKVEILEKTISGKKYYVVWVGKFLSSDQAMVFKARLETAENETFQVVAR